MAGRSKRARPSFLWQGILILGPVLVLLAIGVWTSWRDRDAMEREVRARMDPVATTLLSEFQDLLHPIRASRANDVVALGVSGTWFEIQPDNSLSQPHQFTWPPTPAPFPENLVDHLNPEPAQLWNQATTAERARSWSQAAELYSAFANVKELLNQNRANTSNSLTEERLRGEAFSRMAAACLHVGDRKAAIQTFDAVLNSFSPGSDTRSEAGLSLAHLAALRIFELTPDFAEIPERWTTNTMQLLALLSNDRSPFGHELALRFQAWLQPKSNDQPSPVNMTEATFRVSEREEVKNWLEAQESWRLYHEAASSFGKEEWPALFWLEGDYSWLGVEQRVPEAAGRGRIFAAISREKIAETLAQIASREDRSGLFAVSLNVHGRHFSFGETAETDWKNRSISRFVEAPQDALSLTIVLAEPARYFSAQRKRQLWTGGLMLAAAGACVLAFISARAAFRKQVILNDQKSNFVSSVSHELRAPIASVRLMAESLERGKISEPQKQQEYFRFIVQECRRLSSLIENVLDFSRIEQGRKQYEFEPTDLLALVRETVRLMEPYAAEKGVTIRVELLALELSPEAVTHSKLKTLNSELSATVDGRAIQQALINLIDNAVKHSARDDTVRVAINPQPSTIRLSVSDNGPGIPAAEHEKIFERFYRLGSELRCETQGVGIGLSIVKHIVEAHGGHVRIESQVGNGSRFTIELPMRK